MSPAVATPAAITVEGVSKQFRLPAEQAHTLKERALHPFRRAAYTRLQALDDVSFDVRRGEFFGIVGRNGSGKSTLLKCLAGIYGTDSGRVFVDGRLSTFIELGVGFNLDLPARDNILINATMLGLTQREARTRTGAIMDFAELHDFADMRLKNYSSGMLVRLAFSVMIQVDADVLLIDEVLAVGDAAFQQKCFDEFARLRREDRTVVLVTHEMGSVQRFCDRAMLLERGRVAEIGDPQDVSRHYLQLNFSQDARAAEAQRGSGEDPVARPDEGRRLLPTGADELRVGDGGAEIINGWFMNAAGEQVDALDAGERATMCLHVRFHEHTRNPVFAFGLRNASDDRVVAGSSERLVDDAEYAPGEDVIVYFGFQNVLGPDRYAVSASVAREGAGLAWMDNRERFTTVVVSSADARGGLVDLPMDVLVQRDVVRSAEAGR